MNNREDINKIKYETMVVAYKKLLHKYNELKNKEATFGKIVEELNSLKEVVAELSHKLSTDVDKEEVVGRSTSPFEERVKQQINELHRDPFNEVSAKRLARCQAILNSLEKDRY